MALLPGIRGPRDLDDLTPDQLRELAAEVRSFLVENVARTGGHLGPNLGVVELTIALHKVFDSPADPIIFDTGHQSYVHKMLTGRQDFENLRSRGGLAGYPQRSESEHDIVESSHASSSLSWADGVSRAFSRTGRRDRHVVAVVGDGALTGGMTWEALNNISDDNDRNLVIVVNDNGRSYAPTIGGMARYLNRVRTNDAYRTLHRGSDTLFRRLGPAARAVYRGVRGGTHGFLSRFTNNEALYSNLDIKYLGPIDGHDFESLIETLELAKTYGAPVIVHAITDKGSGYAPALSDEADQFHAVGKIDPITGEAIGSGGGTQWTDVFAEELTAVGAERDDVIAMTAAMLRPTGLQLFSEHFPRARVRRRYRRAARRRVRRRSRLRWSAPGRRHLRHLHEPRVRSGDDGCGPAQGGRHVRARSRRGDRPRRSEPPRHLGPRDAAARSRHPDRRAP
ncbi:1-deoxy-D-xylulose-5-phosphate synthase [Microbacterium proteolyticum]|nr:1-deoxy-D-xylulose-5-phosphate synthase [Microbacterium proteolyticum]